MRTSFKLPPRLQVFFFIAKPSWRKRLFSCNKLNSWRKKTTCRIIFSQETRTINLRFKTTIHKNHCMKVSTIVEIHFVFFLGTSWDQLRGKCEFSMSFLSFDCLKISLIPTNGKRREPMRTQNKIMKAREKCNR